MAKTISQLRQDWKNAKAAHKNFIEYNGVKFDLKFGDALDKAVTARAGTDGNKSYDAVLKCRDIAMKYLTRIRSYKPGGSGKNSKKPPQGSGDNKGLLTALYDIERGLGIDLQYVKHLYGK